MGRSIDSFRPRSRTGGQVGKSFYRPCRDGHFLLRHFPALRIGLLSFRPYGTTPSGVKLSFTLMRMRMPSGWEMLQKTVRPKKRGKLIACLRENFMEFFLS
jgi:hypothetical protein